MEEQKEGDFDEVAARPALPTSVGTCRRQEARRVTQRVRTGGDARMSMTQTTLHMLDGVMPLRVVL